MCWDRSEVNIVEDLRNAIDVAEAEVDLMECIMELPVIAAVYKLETTFKCLRCGSRTEGGPLKRQLGVVMRNVEC